MTSLQSLRLTLKLNFTNFTTGITHLCQNSIIICWEFETCCCDVYVAKIAVDIMMLYYRYINYFMLNGTVYLNNSAVPILGVGEGDHALQCRTSRDECCKASLAKPVW